MRKIVYISGPVTGTTDYAERFQQAEEWLKYEYGVFKVFPQFPQGAFDSVEIVNPVNFTKHLPSHTKWSTYMEVLIPLLKTCDAIYLLKGWENSRGSQIEKLFAEACGIDIGYESDRHTEPSKPIWSEDDDFGF